MKKTKDKTAEIDKIRKNEADFLYMSKEGVAAADKPSFDKATMVKEIKESAKIEKVSSLLSLIAYGAVLYTISSLYFVGGRPKNLYLLFPEVAVFSILGFFHAYYLWRGGAANLVAAFLIWTAWYSVVLLPASGLGMIEWGALFFILSGNLLGRAFRGAGQSAAELAVYGCALFLLKVMAFYLFPNNLYDALILSNQTMRGVVTGVAIISIIMLFRVAQRNIKSAWSELPLAIKEKDIEKDKGRGKKIRVALGGFFRFFSLPVFLAIIGAVALGALVLFDKIYRDIGDFVGVVLERVLSTGKGRVTPSTLYYALEAAVIVGVLFYNFLDRGNKK